MTISQKQIAEKLGVSIALVSRVLSGKAVEIGIAPETIARVLATAEEMGYVPSAAALALKGKSTRTIGVTVYDFNDPFFGALIKQIQILAHEHNYSLILAGFLNRNPNDVIHTQTCRIIKGRTWQGAEVHHTDNRFWVFEYVSQNVSTVHFCLVPSR